jgi:multidrug efflux system outer membrane protein
MIRLRPHFPGALGAAASICFGACTVGSDFRGAPVLVSEETFKNAGFTAPPPAGSWWSLFDDPQLGQLMAKADLDGPAGQAALARFDQARAALGLARVDQFPAVTGDAYARRQRDSGNANFSSGTYEDYRAALNLSWEVDLWGRVRRQVRGAEADLAAARFEYQAAALSLRAEVARAYLSLRFADAEIALLEETAVLRDRARTLMQKRFEGGASSRIDLDRAITEAEAVHAELAQVKASRARFENALAALTGQSASGFRLPATGTLPAVPAPPAAVPSDLTRRRPDVAAAERRLASASEKIGFVIASYLPKISVGAEGGVRALSTSDLFDRSSLLWNLGPELQLPTLQGGSLGANKAKVEALYREALEVYRDTLLRAVQETEDSLVDSKQLAVAAASRKRGARSAGKVSALTRKLYTAGAVDYFEVVDADRTALADRRASLQVDLARALAATRLIQALGGGWTRY